MREAAKVAAVCHVVFVVPFSVALARPSSVLLIDGGLVESCVVTSLRRSPHAGLGVDYLPLLAASSRSRHFLMRGSIVLGVRRRSNHFSTCVAVSPEFSASCTPV